MIRRVDGLGSLVVVLALAALASCTQAAGPPVPERTGAGAQAWSNAGADDNTPEANIVVNVGSVRQCSGTLLTPRIVLTANHCLFGDEADGCGRPTSPLLDVTVGPDPDDHFQEPAPKFHTSAFASRLNACQDSAHRAEDIALLFLAQPVTTSSITAAAGRQTNVPETPRVHRPPLLPPTSDSLLGVAGYAVQDSLTRRRKLFSGDSLSLHPQEPPIIDESYWSFSTDITAAHPGDSGGPLFIQNPDLSRDVVGVLSASENDAFNFLPNILSPNNAAWVRFWVQERFVPGNLGHTSNWLFLHGKTNTDWWGELDYSGPCIEAVDRDCDGWIDRCPADFPAPCAVHDNCIYVANPGQEDTFDNGIGDACRRCPWDPDNDADDDFVCVNGPPGTRLPQYKIDNCPTKKNPDQANCNLLVETAFHKEVLGDACDPVPCAASTQDPGSTVSHCTPAGLGESSCELRVVRSHVTSTPLASQPADGPLVPAPATTTQVRFCQKRFPDFKCDADTVLSDDQLSFDELTPTASRPWHRITFGSQVPAARSVGLVPARGATFLWDYVNRYDDLGQAVEKSEWFYQTDWSFFLSNAVLPLPDDFPACQGARVGGTCLQGSLWLHAATSLGVDSHGDNLANFHVPFAPDPLKLVCLEQFVPLPTTFAAVASATSTPYVSSFSVGELVWRPDGTDRVVDIQGAAQASFVFPSARGTLGALQENSVYVPFSDVGVGAGCGGSVLSRDLAAAIAARPWVSVAEPMGRLTRLAFNVVAVSPDATGSRIESVLVDNDGQLLLTSELPGLADPANAPGLLPPPAGGFTGVFSAMAGEAFIIGNVDGSGSGSDIRVRAVGAPSWGRVPTGNVNLGRVLAATYAFSDGQLWIVDAVTSARGVPATEQLRVVRVDGKGGGASIVAQGPRLHGTIPYASVDRDGSVLLAFADRTQFFLIKGSWSPSGGVAFRRLRAEPGQLVRAPIVDENGYSFVVGAKDAPFALSRKSELRPSACDGTPGDPNVQPPPCAAPEISRLF